MSSPLKVGKTSYRQLGEEEDEEDGDAIGRERESVCVGNSEAAS